MDIVVTIPKSEYLNDDKETEQFLKSPGDIAQFWTLNRMPKQIELGDRVYFVKVHKVESSMRIIDIRVKSTTKCETTGRIWTGKCQIFMDDLRHETIEVAVKGFQGFRYRWWN